MFHTGLTADTGHSPPHTHLPTTVALGWEGGGCTQHALSLPYYNGFPSLPEKATFFFFFNLFPLLPPPPPPIAYSFSVFTLYTHRYFSSPPAFTSPMNHQVAGSEEQRFIKWSLSACPQWRASPRASRPRPSPARQGHREVLRALLNPKRIYSHFLPGCLLPPLFAFGEFDGKAPQGFCGVGPCPPSGGTLPCPHAAPEDNIPLL